MAYAHTNTHNTHAHNMAYTYPDTYMHAHTHKLTQTKIQKKYVQDEYMYLFASLSPAW